MDNMGTFHGTEIDYGKEYCEARKIMGQKDTDMDQLISTVGHLFLNCPTHLQDTYQSLLLEIGERQRMLETMASLDMDNIGGKS